MIKSEAFLSIQKRSAVIINQPRFSSPHLLKDSLTPSVPPLLLPREGEEMSTAENPPLLLPREEEEMSTAEHPPPTVSISSYQAAGRGHRKRTGLYTNASTSNWLKRNKRKSAHAMQLIKLCALGISPFCTDGTTSHSWRCPNMTTSSVCFKTKAIDFNTKAINWDIVL